MTRRPLRIRLLAGVLVITILTFAVFDGVAVIGLRRYLLARTDTTLRTAAHLAELRLGKVLAGGRGMTAQQHQDLSRVLGNYYLAFVAHGRTTPIADSNPELVPKPPADPTVGVARTVPDRGGEGELRLLAVRTGGGMLVVDVSLDGVDRAVQRLELIIGIGSSAAIVLIGFGVVVLVRRGLRPLETMAAQADRITAGDLADRVDPQETGSEVGRLGVALNGMLARIEASVAERETSLELMRRFLADASHELRTPLASLRANAELYQQGALRDPAQVAEAMRRIGIEARRMSGMVDDMLRLARLDQLPERQRDPVDLTAVITESVDQARIAAPTHTWLADVAPDLVVAGDEDLLRSAMNNLMANVRNHTPAGTTAIVRATRAGESVVLDVGDDGPGVSPDRLPHVFERFYRAGASGFGAGLGLAIVAETASACGGEAAATTNPPHGLRITLTLPDAVRYDSP